MMARAAFSDPGGEVANAPVGTEAWAQRWRLELQAIVKDLSYQPERAERYFQQGRALKVWRLLNKRDGARFASLEEFCEYPEPWGLGTPWKTIRPFFIALHGTAVVAAQVKALNPHGANQHGEDGGLDHIKSTQGGTSAEYLAARLRRDHPAIWEDLAAGKYMNVRAAARAAGIVKPVDPVAAALRALARLTDEQLMTVGCRLDARVFDLLRAGAEE